MYIFPSPVHCEGLGIVTSLIAMNKPSAQNLTSKCHYTKKYQAPWRNPDSRVRTEKVLNETGTSLCQKVMKGTQRMMRTY